MRVEKKHKLDPAYNKRDSVPGQAGQKEKDRRDFRDKDRRKK